MAFQTPEVFPATASFPAVASFPSPASFPSAYDPNAVAYFTASGVTDPTQKLNISQFFTGLKKNNLWPFLLEGWSFRSTQNVGSGASAPGLKGVISLSLVASPTWGSNGLSLNGSNQYAVTTAPPLKNSGINHTVCVCWSTNNVGVSQYGASFGSSASNNPIDGTDFAAGGPNFQAFTRTLAGANITTDAAVIDSAQLISVNAANFGASTSQGFSGTGIKQFWAKRLYFLSTPDISVDRFAVGALVRGAASNFVNGEISSCFVFYKPLSNAENLGLYTLYKNTIGQGLSLP